MRERAAIGGVYGVMVSFCVAFLVVFLLRADLPPAGVACAITSGFVVVAILAERVWRRRAAAPAPLVTPVVAATALVGALLAGGLPRALPPPVPPPPPLNAASSVVRAMGLVASGATSDARGAHFSLVDGPLIHINGLALPPPPYAVVAVIGRLDASGRSITVVDPLALERIAPPPPLHPAVWLNVVRQICRDRLASACPPQTARVLGAVLLGDRSLPLSARQDLVATGTMHIVAVSGTHLGLLLMGLRVFTRRTGVLAVSVTVYAALTGMDPPVLRSLVLSLGMLLGRSFGRALPAGAHLLLSACVVLAVDGPALFEAGFQLSFTAFFGLVTLGSKPAGAQRDAFGDALDEAEASGLWGRARRAIATSLRASLGATLLTTPTTVCRFHRLAPVGIPATLVMAPIIPALLWLSALIIMFPWATPLVTLATALVELLLRLASFFAAVPAGGFVLPQPATAGVALFIGALTAQAAAFHHAAPRVRVGGMIVVAATGLLLLVPARVAPGCVQLEAGRGAATLFVAHDAAVLVDTGPEGAHVADQLLTLGVGMLDAVVITHRHADHTGGLADVARRLDVSRVVHGPTAHGIGASAGWEGPVTRVSAGDTMEYGGVHLAVAGPPLHRRWSDNDNSLILDADIAGLRVIVPGDAEEPACRAALARLPPGPVDALLLPHHGSENAALADLLLHLAPRRLLLSARAGFPAEETIRVVDAANIPVSATFQGAPTIIPAPRQSAGGATGNQQPEWRPPE